MNDNQYRRQFLITPQKMFRDTWKKVVINEYNLFYHPELEFTNSGFDGTELVMLGSMYDWETPENSNQQLLDTLAATGSFEHFLRQLAKYAGQYVIVYFTPNKFILLNDVCAQHEIYYDASFSTFGSQPKLIGDVIELQPHTDTKAALFYSSQEFLSKKLFAGATTHVENIRHLLPNHYIDLNKKTVIRYFPSAPLVPLSIEEVAPKACQILKGYTKAIAMRKKMAMAVTGGYDSRMLFLASLDEDCKYYILKHKNMSDKHHDITVPQRLTKIHGKLFEVIPDAENFEDISDSVDFQRKIHEAGKKFENHIYLNGNISEVARNFYGFKKNMSAEDLAYINGYGKSAYVTYIYRQWLENATLFKTNGYAVLDMFYWEERLGIMVAKEKTMMNALGIELFSPFCSRDLILLLLSTPPKDRDYCFNKLYDTIMLQLSPKALKIPINPYLKKDIIRLMKRLRIYDLYRNLGLKFRFLKF